MDFRELKRQTDNIEMSDEMKRRIIMRCRAQYAAEREKSMKKHTYKRPAFAAIALVICLCLAIGVGAAAGGGVFSDVKNWRGTVVGTEYTAAEGEISVTAKAENKVLALSAVMEKPEFAPYSSFEELGGGSYTITDKDGNVVKEGELSTVPVEDGSAEFEVYLAEFEEGEYTFKIGTFIGGSKADQPLPVKGNWEVEFTA